MGRPSIDPELMIRMLIVGYVFAIRSERLICREVQVNLAGAFALLRNRTQRVGSASEVP
jgi:transposase